MIALWCKQFWPRRDIEIPPNPRGSSEKFIDSQSAGGKKGICVSSQEGIWVGGGCKYFLMFTPKIGEGFPFLLIFLRWVGSTTNQICVGGFIFFLKNHLLCLGPMIQLGLCLHQVVQDPLGFVFAFFGVFLRIGIPWDSSPCFHHGFWKNMEEESKAKQGRENRPVFAKGFGICRKKQAVIHKVADLSPIHFRKLFATDGA